VAAWADFTYCYGGGGPVTHVKAKYEHERHHGSDLISVGKGRWTRHAEYLNGGAYEVRRTIKFYYETNCPIALMKDTPVCGPGGYFEITFWLLFEPTGQVFQEANFYRH
jgi:hypothetical protein